MSSINDDKGGTLQGSVPDISDAPGLFEALNQAFDYRGDVTLTLKDGRSITGYLFDRRKGTGLGDSVVRIIPADSDARVTVRYDEVARLEFSGRDPAQGKTWENWVRRYVEKKRAGQAASIEAEKLD